VVREHISQAAAHCSLPLGFSLDMVPILEEELLGYELVPAGLVETCLTLGCKPDGEPVLRKECLANAPPGALQLAAMDGRTVARAARALPSRSGRQDMRFPDWPSAARFACAELEHFSPGAPRRPPLLTRTPLWSERSSRPHRGSRSGAPSFISAVCQRKSSLDMRCMAPMAHADNFFFAIRLSGHCIGNRAAKSSAKHGQR
jgi:hypothetical protein